MKKIALLSVLALLLIPLFAVPAEAQYSAQYFAKMAYPALRANFPTCVAGIKGFHKTALDSTSTSACTTGGSTNVVECICNGSTWVINSNAGGDASGPASSVASQAVSFNSTSGKLFQAGGTATLAGNVALAASGLAVATTGYIFEGATADTIEGLLAAADPTSADKTWTLPDATGAIMVSDGVPSASGGLFQAGQDLKYEGTTADDSEGMIRFPADPAVDAIAAIPADSGFMVLSATDLQGATGFWGVANGVAFEGASADDYETTLAVTDPTADRTITLPNATGTVALVGGYPVTATGSAAAGGANVSEVTITVKDAAAATVAAVHHIDVWLSDAATCEGLTVTSASGTVQAKAASGTDLQVYSAKKAVRVQTLATGVYILEITDTAKTGFIVCAEVNGKAAVIDTLVAGDYGA